jgi:hypothetical protein
MDDTYLKCTKDSYERCFYPAELVVRQKVTDYVRGFSQLVCFVSTNLAILFIKLLSAIVGVPVTVFTVARAL